MAALLAYLFYFVAATASPIQRRWLAVKRETDSRGQVDFAFKVVLINAILGLLIILFEPFQIAGNPRDLFLLALTSGLFGAGFFISSYVAQRHVDAGITTLVSNIYTPITIMLATIFLNEKLTMMQIGGTALLLLSIFLISKKHRVGKLHFDKYFLLMTASGVMLGILLTAERALQKITGFSAGTLLSWWSQCIALGVVSYLTRSKSPHTTKDVAITGVLRFFQSLSWVILIFVVGNLSLVSAVTTFKIVVVFVVGAIFLHEREDLPRKVLGSFIAITGLLMMR